MFEKILDRNRVSRDDGLDLAPVQQSGRFSESSAVGGAVRCVGAPVVQEKALGSAGVATEESLSRMQGIDPEVQVGEDLGYFGECTHGEPLLAEQPEDM